MRVLLDECLPRRLKGAITDHDVSTVPKAGWAGKQNGELLRLASAGYDVFVTMDQNLEYQQNLQGSGLTILVLQSRTNRYEDLLPLVPRLQLALQGDHSPGQLIQISL